MTDRYAVIGNPIAHSKSPEIHAMFARATGQDLVYTRIHAELDQFRATVESFQRGGGVGLNVTVPFKREAFDLAATRSVRATLAGAVNTLTWRGDHWAGDTTDGVGLIRDLEINLERPLAGARVLLLGAGGAARGVIGALLESGASMVAITNRTHRAAIEIAEAHAAVGSLTVLPFAEIGNREFDVVINATSAGLQGESLPLPAHIFSTGVLAYDMVYGKPTPFLGLAKASGARTSDGLGMLVEQAAEAFYIWRGLRPATAPVVAYLRDALRGQ